MQLTGTKAGVKALEQSGNRSVNKAYEAKLRDPVENKKCEKLHQYKAVNMQEFVEDKYKNRLLCNEGTYHHVKDRHGKHQKRSKGQSPNRPVLQLHVAYLPCLLHSLQPMASWSTKAEN